MRNVDFFLAASLGLGCLVLTAVSLARSEAAVTLFPNVRVIKVAQCSRLLQSYHDGSRTMPESGPERTRYEDCYFLICGGRRVGV